MISFIWAMDENRLIGSGNRLPWRLPEDLKFFKNTTMNHPIVMGRKTFESIGKPLPGRINIILTKDKTYKKEGCIVMNNKSQLLDWIESQEKEVFITGGSEIFKQLMDEVDSLYVTKIYSSFEGDTYFPVMDWCGWKAVWAKKGIKNEKNPYDYEFYKYKKKQHNH
ncbi:dihydrofolate reductase [Falsibacillus albus]|uniref:Dihydrofolate reductase n=1 Tax=Falsibacillus albus TaxID=2478915 RepID=A0A3L7JYJ1_9BACI|nr:dihydrofolate reductase [Falsibacillus albus]RLQ95179.1 dihydrofolate reductase [Falsibacillus albus]